MWVWITFPITRMRHGADGVSEVTGYGDEIDVVALVDILK
jgi:hypothetical protein